MTDIYPGAVPVKGPVPSIIPGNNPDIIPYTYDLEKAKAELALSKYAGNPEAQPIELVWCAEVPEEEKIALLINANLSQLGIPVDIVKQPFGSMIESAQSIESTPNVSSVLTAPSYFETGAVLTLGVGVLAVVVPLGGALGLLAGYFGGRFATLIMRVTDIFLALPPLILALCVGAILKPALFNSMMAVCIAWWPWYTRLVYGMAMSVKNE
jgi:hypothetical protein